ncbi:organic cation transporter protein-like [Patiria miniata]|uniref:Major facilitator superfamily (MFS) profile domain-containing protein n=1 Tax=Patiria miniata TaxID=46514 RepID=A0A913Z1J1_PATMI|nr:organic cation transporter protein-like [Patiria miniata]
MDVDASFEILGGFGGLQTLNFLIFMLCGNISSWHLMGVVFTTSMPDEYRCSLPPNGTSLRDGEGYIPEQCQLIYEDEAGGENETMSCVYGWDYYSAHGETSVVDDLDLVCDRAILVGTVTSIYFGGILAGAYVAGQLSDIYGRRLVVFGSLIGLVATGVGLSFMWNFAGMLALRFIHGFFLPGTMFLVYIRLIEMLTPRNRLTGQLVFDMMWVVSIALLAPLAYALPNWRHLQLAISLCQVPVIFLIWFSYESIRWLVQRGRVEEAEKILQRIAKSKNISHPGYFLLAQQDPDLQNGNRLEKIKENSIELETKTTLEKDQELVNPQQEKSNLDNSNQRPPASVKKRATIIDLFKTRTLTIRALIVFYWWFACNVVYYGFFINAANLVGNKYLNFFLISVTEAPAYIVNYLMMKRFGRRRPLIFVCVISGVTCVITGLVPSETASGTDLTVVILVFAMLGKLFSTAAFDIIFLMSAEVFPTVLRSAAFGASAMVGKVGGMVAPFIVYLNVIHNSIPMIVFGVLSLLAGLLVLPLPETSDRTLPETLDDGVKLTSKAGPRDEKSPADV